MPFFILKKRRRNPSNIAIASPGPAAKARPGKNGARCRFRTCDPGIEHQAVANADALQNAPALRLDDLALVVAAWPRLSPELRQAIVAMVQSVAGRKEFRQ